MLIIILACLGGALCYCVWRLLLYRTAYRRFSAQMPPERSLSWRYQARAPVPVIRIECSNAKENTEEEPLGHAEPLSYCPSIRQEFSIFENGVWAATLDGAVQGFAAASAFEQIDPSVLKAIEFSTADHLHSLPSIDSYINDHFFSATESSADGWLHRLEGYVAEQKVAAALEATGHHVEFAAIPNQPAWDLLVDGQPLQVKMNAGDVKQFLAHHPDIHVATGHDVAGQIHDAHVQGFHVIDHSAIQEVTTGSLHGLKDGFHPSLHFPVVTFAFSAFRETRLLIAEKTTIERAATNIAVDVGAVSGGIWLGAKAGALALSWLGPIGAAIGGFIGVVSGAVAGKWAANGIRFNTYNQVHVEYMQLISSADEDTHERSRRSQQKVLELRSSCQARYEVRRGMIAAAAQAQLVSIQEGVETAIIEFNGGFPSKLKLLIRQLRDEETDVLTKLPLSRFGFLIPMEQDLLRSVTKSWFRRARRIVGSEAKAYMGSKDRSLQILFQQIVAFFNRYDFELEPLQNDVRILSDIFAKSRTAAAMVQHDAIRDAAAARCELISEFNQKVEAIYADVKTAFESWHLRIKACVERLRQEGRPLGIDI